MDKDDDYVSEFKISFLRPQILSRKSYTESIHRTDSEFDIHEMTESFVSFLKTIGYNQETIKSVVSDYFYDPEEHQSDEEE